MEPAASPASAPLGLSASAPQPKKRRRCKRRLTTAKDSAARSKRRKFLLEEQQIRRVLEESSDEYDDEDILDTIVIAGGFLILGPSDGQQSPPLQPVNPVSPPLQHVNPVSPPPATSVSPPPAPPATTATTAVVRTKAAIGETRTPTAPGTEMRAAGCTAALATLISPLKYSREPAGPRKKISGESQPQDIAQPLSEISKQAERGARDETSADGSAADRSRPAIPAVGKELVDDLVVSFLRRAKFALSKFPPQGDPFEIDGAQICDPETGLASWPLLRSRLEEHWTVDLETQGVKINWHFRIQQQADLDQCVKVLSASRRDAHNIVLCDLVRGNRFPDDMRLLVSDLQARNPDFWKGGWSTEAAQNGGPAQRSMVGGGAGESGGVRVAEAAEPARSLPGPPISEEGAELWTTSTLPLSRKVRKRSESPVPNLETWTSGLVKKRRVVDNSSPDPPSRRASRRPESGPPLPPDGSGHKPGDIPVKQQSQLSEPPPPTAIAEMVEERKGPKPASKADDAATTAEDPPPQKVEPEPVPPVEPGLPVESPVGSISPSKEKSDMAAEPASSGETRDASTEPASPVWPNRERNATARPNASAERLAPPGGKCAEPASPGENPDTAAEPAPPDGKTDMAAEQAPPRGAPVAPARQEGETAEPVSLRGKHAEPASPGENTDTAAPADGKTGVAAEPALLGEAPDALAWLKGETLNASGELGSLGEIHAVLASPGETESAPAELALQRGKPTEPAPPTSGDPDAAVGSASAGGTENASAELASAGEKPTDLTSPCENPDVAIESASAGGTRSVSAEQASPRETRAEPASSNEEPGMAAESASAGGTRHVSVEPASSTETLNTRGEPPSPASPIENFKGPGNIPLTLGPGHNIAPSLERGAQSMFPITPYNITC